MNIRFIGIIGVGKTTALCHLLRLTLNNSPILDTGTGRTTVCEVHIRIRERIQYSSIFIDKFTLQEFGIFLKKLIQDPGSVSTEIETIIKNIVQLGENHGTNSFNETRNNYRNNLKQFYQLCINRANYYQRNINRILNENEDDYSWIKKHFHEINTGRHNGFGIPKRITIDIKKTEILNQPHINDNFCFIDTKGIEYINHYPRVGTIEKEIFCSSFVNGPEKALINQIIASNNFLKNKFILLLSKDDAPIEVNGANDDYDTGVEIKINEFRRATVGIILPENILFFDSRKYNEQNILNILSKITKK